MVKQNHTFGPKYILRVIGILLLIVFVILLVFMWGQWEPEPGSGGDEPAPIATQGALTNEAIEHLLTETPVP